jgi:predicted DNA-binding WGR domain protein
VATGKIKSDKSPTISDGQYEVPDGWVKELNFFDISGDKAHTKGTSNKFYHAELQIDKNGNCQIFTMYGPTGKVQAREWRYFDKDRTKAEQEFRSIINSKIKKGYVEIDVAQRALGSVEAQKQVKPVDLKNIDNLVTGIASNLTEGQKSIVSLFFGAQNTWIAQTLKCPLGQLTNNQIDLGRDVLNQAKLVVNASSKLSDANLKQVEDLTNRFYGLIPHNLGAGARGQMLDLRLDSLDKIVQKEQDLDILLDAKQVNAVLRQDSTIDDKYNSLNCDFNEIPQSNDIYKLLSDYFMSTKVRGHGFDREKISRVWSMTRKDQKETAFIINAEKIAKSCHGHTFVNDTTKMYGKKNINWSPNNRIDLDKQTIDLYNRANVWMCWHGTRSANLVGITRRGLLIRPAGAAYTGSYFGDGKYFAHQSTKSLNYCDGGYWTGGKQSNKKYMFVIDVAFGDMYSTTSPSFFKGPPKGFHSVYGRTGPRLKNDEMITYDFDDSKNQSRIAYLLEIKA